MLGMSSNAPSLEDAVQAAKDLDKALIPENTRFQQIQNIVGVLESLQLGSAILKTVSSEKTNDYAAHILHILKALEAYDNLPVVPLNVKNPFENSIYEEEVTVKKHVAKRISTISEELMLTTTLIDRTEARLRLIRQIKILRSMEQLERGIRDVMLAHKTNAQTIISKAS